MIAPAAPPALRDLLRSIARRTGRRLLAYALVGGAGVLFFSCAFAGVWLFSLVETRLDVVNATQVPQSVQLDGEPARTVEPGEWILLQPWPGGHELVAGSIAGTVRAHVDVGVGSSQVWNVDGAARFAVVRRTLVDGREVPDLATVRRFVPPADVFAFPPDVTLPSVDWNFHTGYAVEGHELHDGAVRLCTLRGADRVLGCESCARWDACVPLELAVPPP